MKPAVKIQFMGGGMDGITMEGPLDCLPDEVTVQRYYVPERQHPDHPFKVAAACRPETYVQDTRQDRSLIYVLESSITPIVEGIEE